MIINPLAIALARTLRFANVEFTPRLPLNSVIFHGENYGTYLFSDEQVAVTTIHKKILYTIILEVNNRRFDIWTLRSDLVQDTDNEFTCEQWQHNYISADERQPPICMFFAKSVCHGLFKLMPKRYNV
jgi:hypothetical protein